MAKISIEKLMQDTVSIQNQIDGLNLLLKNKKNLLAKYFEESGSKSLTNDECTVYVSEKVKLEYDIPAIQDKLTKEQCNLFLVKERSITAWDEFVKYMKQLGVDPNILKKYIHTSVKVDEAKLNNAYEKNRISIKELEGCYKANVTKSIVLRLKNIDSTLTVK